jgi:hypothetical protein
MMSSSVPLTIPVFVRRAGPGSRHGEPITQGVPLARGAASAQTRFALYGPDGGAVAFQTRILDRWADGSTRWLLIDFQASLDNGQDEAAYSLVVGAPTPVAPATAAPLSASPRGHAIEVTTGNCRVTISPDTFPFANVEVNGRAVYDARRSGLRVIDDGGQLAAVKIERAIVEEQGPLRAVVLVTGRIERGATDRTGASFLDLFARIHFYAGLPVARLLITLRNPKAATHPGGYWDLGDPASVLLREASIAFALSAPTAAPATEAQLYLSAEPTDREPEPVSRDFELYQDSSGGEHWASPNHITRERKVATTFRGYRRRNAGQETNGLRATPIAIAAAGPNDVLAISVPQFWQNFPKSLEGDAPAGASAALRVGLFPKQTAAPHEIQGGEQKTHELFVAFGADGVSAVPLEWTRARLEPALAPEYVERTEAVPFLTAGAHETSDTYRALVNQALEGESTFEHKREVIDQYGWRHYGDIYGDHEAVRQPGLVSHYNNQYDVVQGFAYQFLRSGDPRWWRQMQDLARHVIDIDIYHTTQDKSAYNHGLFWHTYHYGDADTATHRTYPKAGADKIGGGGPSADQNYTSGLMLHYFLTGETASRETVVDSAQYVIDIEDGSKTVFRYLAGGATGNATASGSYDYHGPGRSPANSLNALIDGHRLTGDAKFLVKAEELLRRVVHPDDNIMRWELLDAERRWFYTMFLQSLGKYLDHKVQIGQRDESYAYGRAALLHYARWMADHETPFLSRSDKLEFPTETWAAQDIRKSDIFFHASRHAEGADRTRFVERGEYFFDYAVTTLWAAKTRSLARPVIILLSNGLMRAWCRLYPASSAPAPERAPAKFAPRQAFVPQRVLAIKRAKALVAGGAVAGLGVLGLGLFWLLS